MVSCSLYTGIATVSGRPFACGSVIAMSAAKIRDGHLVGAVRLYSRATDVLRQPPLVAGAPAELHAAIAGLALGGAERIVVDWARRIQPPWTPHLIVLRDHTHEWPVPPAVRVTRLG